MLSTSLCLLPVPKFLLINGEGIHIIGGKL